MKKIDVCISYYGKPYQTMVTLFSLLEHSEQYIDKLYLIIERQQPYLDAWEHIFNIKQLFKNKGLILYFPEYFVPWMSDVNPESLSREKALCIRYEYALANTDKPYLLILHNDMLVKKDFIGEMLQRFDGENIAGVGTIGQCWNCPAFTGNYCSPEIFPAFQPSKKEALKLYQMYDSPRKKRGIKTIKEGKFFPMPECRLNEHLCLLDTKIYRENTIPLGKVPYFGGVWDGSDTAAAWFYQMIEKGFQFRHINYEPFVIHAPFSSTNNGTEADSQRTIYDEIETQAQNYLRKHYYIQVLPFFAKIRGKLLAARKVILHKAALRA